MNWSNILLEAGLQIPIDKVEISLVCPLHEDRVSSLSINICKSFKLIFPTSLYNDTIIIGIE